MAEVHIKNIGLKNLLSRFEGHQKLSIQELGDTLHPASGFVDESYFQNIKTIDDFLHIDYDFQGLVVFVVRVDGLRIEYKSSEDEFVVSGSEGELGMIQRGMKNS